MLSWRPAQKKGLEDSRPFVTGIRVAYRHTVAGVEKSSRVIGFEPLVPFTL